MSEPASQTPSQDAPRVVRCAFCKAENIVGATLCRECDSHLYVVCRHCGRSNPRELGKCAGCGSKLGGSRWRRRWRRLFRKFDPVTVIVALVVLLMAGLWLSSCHRSTPPPLDEIRGPNVSE